MILPGELQPTTEIDISLPSGAVARLPVCRPVFSPWRGAPLGFDYGGKPPLNYDGEACFAELAILRILLKHGWSGAWVETFGGTHYLSSMPKKWSLRSEHVPIPADKEEKLKRIWKTAKTTACFDVFAWRGSEVLFCEAKHQGEDDLTDAQVRFIEGALARGIPPESLLIAEWTDVPLTS